MKNIIKTCYRISKIWYVKTVANDGCEFIATGGTSKQAIYNLNKKAIKFSREYDYPEWPKEKSK